MTRQRNETSESAADNGGTFENLGRKLDDRPEIQAAEKALRQARKRLHKAQKQYHRVRGQASEGFEQLREKKASDLLDATLKFVRKHPGPGVLVAAACGMFLGRLFRR